MQKCQFVYIYLVHRSSQRHGSLAVASRPLTLSHQRRLYLHPAIIGAVFFFHHWLVVLLSLKEIVVGGLPCSDWSLGLSLLNTHCFQHLGHTFSEGHYFLRPTLICFCFTLCYPYVFSAFAPLANATAYPFGLLSRCKALGIKSN